MIGAGGIKSKRLLIGERIGHWCRGRRDRLASRGKHPRACGKALKWYLAGYNFTAKQLRAGRDVVQLGLNLEGGDADGSEALPGQLAGDFAGDSGA